MRAKKIYVAADHAALELKAALVRHAAAAGYAVEDLGTHTGESVDYPDYADALAAALSKDSAAAGVLICGSGIGMSIRANRHPHIRAALCWNEETARLSRQHNNANVLCLGARLIAPDVAQHLFDVFMTTDFEGGRHEKRVAKLSAIPSDCTEC